MFSYYCCSQIARNFVTSTDLNTLSYSSLLLEVRFRSHWTQALLCFSGGTGGEMSPHLFLLLFHFFWQHSVCGCLSHIVIAGSPSQPFLSENSCDNLDSLQKSSPDHFPLLNLEAFFPSTAFLSLGNMAMNSKDWGYEFSGCECSTCPCANMQLSANVVLRWNLIEQLRSLICISEFMYLL